MTAKMHYKDDKSFKQFLAMSVCGERAAIKLMISHGHDFEFNDFGAGSTEVTKDATKKRQRKPDLICRNCGQKLEVRAKSSPKIAMSDSASRPFDRELAAADWVGFIVVKRKTDQSLGGAKFDCFDPDHYEQIGEMYVVRVAQLTQKRKQLAEAKRKNESQGTESYLEWPTITAPVTGSVKAIEKSSGFDGKIIISNGNSTRDVAVKVQTGWYSYGGLRVGKKVIRGQTILCGLAKPVNKKELACVCPPPSHPRPLP